MRIQSFAFTASVIALSAAQPASGQVTGPTKTVPPATDGAPATNGRTTGGQATSGETSNDPANNQIEDIIVTAQRRAENSQTVPISIQVYGGDALRERGVADVRRLATIDPSINLSASGGQTTVSIRGVGNSNATETGEPAVAIATDGVFNNRAYSLTATLYDIDRIEVLRGPQGTLFGRNTTGGVISIVSNRPTENFESRLTAEAGNYGRLNFDGFINLPLSDTLEARASFQTRSHNGYRNNPPLNQHGDDERTSSGRFQLAYKPSDSLKFWVAAMYTTETGLGVVGEIDPFVYMPGSREPFHEVPLTISDGKTFVDPANSDQQIDTLDFKWGADLKLGSFAALTYIGGYNHIDFSRPTTFTVAGLPAAFLRREHPTTINNELRLSSQGDGPFIWQAGVYNFRERSNLFTTFTTNPGSTTSIVQYYFNTPVINADSTAVFGQASYKLTNQFKLTAGGRYTWDSKLRQGDQIFPAGSLFSPAGGGRPFSLIGNQNGSSDFSHFTYLLGADFQVAPRNLLYAKYSTGYKAGGFTSGFSFPANYKPEYVSSYEVGTKNDFLDRRVRLNASAYLMNYTNQQVTQYVPPCTGCAAAALVVNAGRSKIYGLEANLSAVLGQLGRLDIAANYLHARYRDYQAIQYWNNANRQLAGNTLPASPAFSISGGFEHSFADVAKGTLTPRINAKYTSTVYFSPFDFNSEKQGPVTLWDASITYESLSHHLTVQGYVENLTDVKRFIFAGETANIGYGFGYGPPRTYGVRLTGKF